MDSQAGTQSHSGVFPAFPPLEYPHRPERVPSARLSDMFKREVPHPAGEITLAAFAPGRSPLNS
jgi:hypothetical protein